MTRRVGSTHGQEASTTHTNVGRPNRQGRGSNHRNYILAEFPYPAKRIYPLPHIRSRSRSDEGVRRLSCYLLVVVAVRFPVAPQFP